MNELEELARRLDRGMYDGLAFSLSCENAFEPHGRASETWEVVWVLRIPDIPYHWRRNDGAWQKGSAPGGMQFRGRTWLGVVQQALKFLAESGLRQQLGEVKAPA